MAEMSLDKIKEYSSLFWLNFKVSLRNSLDNISTAIHYYHNTQFAKVDLSLLWSYFFNNPFKISKKFLLSKQADDIYAYGETPLTTFDQIVRACGVTKEDVFYELGSGRGRTCFWVNAFIGCETVGIEYIPEFVKKADKLVKRFNLSNIRFVCEDFSATQFKNATVIYLYGTCLEDDVIQNLTQKFSKMPSGTKIITVSYSLNSYSNNNEFEVMKRFPAHFTWGEGDVYLNVKK